MLGTDLIHFAALDGVGLVVSVVELNLYHLHFGMLGEDHVEHFVLVVEGEAEMAYLAFLLQLPRSLVGLATFELLVVVAVLCVHKVEVEVIHLAPRQLLLEEGTDVFLLVEVGVGELVGEEELAAVVTRRDAVGNGRLRLAAVVAVCRVEVVESGSDEGISHTAELFVVDATTFQLRQSHTTESEVAVYLGEERIREHNLFLQKIFDDEISADDLQQHAGDADTEILEAKGEGAEHQRLDE